MKILIISEFFPLGKDLKFTGGVETRNYFVAKNLAKDNKVTIIARRIANLPSREKVGNLEIIRVGQKTSYDATVGSFIPRGKFILNAISLGKSLNIDIVEGTNFITHFIAKRISASKKIPCVAWYPDVWIGEWVKNVGTPGIFGEVLERVNLLQGFDHYIAISHETARKLKKQVKGEISVVPCGVQKTEFKNGKKVFPRTIICISRLTKYKNIKTLVLAFAHLTLNDKNLKLLIVGSGPEEKKLKNLSNHLNLKQKVSFVSNLSRKELIDLISQSYVFSLPSKVEGFGIVTIEAASAGIPYVISDIPVNKEITKNGVGGFLVDPQKPLAFSEKIQMLLQNKKLYRRKSSESLELSKGYNWEDITNKTLKIYKALI